MLVNKMRAFFSVYWLLLFESTRSRTRGNNATTQRVVNGSRHCCRVPVGTRPWFGCIRWRRRRI